MGQTSWMERDINESDLYSFADPLRFGDDESHESALISSLSATPAFRRLADIRFLGGLDYALIPHPNGAKGNSRYTRAQHSHGVATLARHYLSLTEHNPGERLLCVAAAMLHDIGHAPFSHTLEPLFQEAFGTNHHKSSEDIIRGNHPLGIEIAESLLSFNISPSSVIDILNGEDVRFSRFFSGPINFDTIEGILRSATYCGWPHLGLTPNRVVEASTSWNSEADYEVVDKFWITKDNVYNLIIRSPAGVLVDTLFQEVVKHSQMLDDNDFFRSESYMFRKIPALRLIESQNVTDFQLRGLLPREVNYVKREFYVDRSSMDRETSGGRYRQRKSKRSLTIS